MTMDISNFYLMTPLLRPKFIRLKLTNIPNEVIKKYNLKEKATKNGSIYIKAKQGMYGLPQAGLLANELLKKRLNKHGYRQSKSVPVLWKHDTQPIQFTLVVDDFGVKYVGEEHAQHLKKHTRGTLQTHLQLDREAIHWDHIGLGLQQTTGAFVHAKLREESLETIPTHRRQTTALTVPKRTHSIRRQETIRNTGIDCTFA